MADLVAERGLIGSCLILGDAYEEAKDIVVESMFTSDIRRNIWRTVCSLFNDGVQKVDGLAVLNSIASRSPEAKDITTEELIECINAVPHAAHAKYYAEIVAGIRE